MLATAALACLHRPDPDQSCRRLLIHVTFLLDVMFFRELSANNIHVLDNLASSATSLAAVLTTATGHRL